jgi:hypothetical protein
MPIGILILSKYLIQADFILTANREGIELFIDWNKNLRDEIVKAFRKAIDRFIEMSNGSDGRGLRYSWPKYLKDSGRAIAFWSDLRRDILNDLKGRRILESRSPNLGLCSPLTIRFIPDSVRLDGEPLVEDAETKHKHLSFSYDTEDGGLSPELSLLGVEKMGESHFVEELRSIIQRQGTDFLKCKSDAWHSKVAATLQRVSAPQRLSGIPLIPLRDGEWVSSSAEHLFLDAESSNLTVPNGIDIRLVDPEACKDHTRRTFFQWLGIGSCSQEKVCQMIIELHQNTTDLNRPREATIKDFVSDAVYLFNTPQFVRRNLSKVLWLLDSKGLPCRGSHLYIDHSAVSPAMSTYANNPESGVRLLHPVYISRAKAEGQETAFVLWLLFRLELSTFPELVRDRQLTKEFQFFSTNAADKLLVYLRDNWLHYDQQFQIPLLTAAPPKYATTLAKALRMMLVTCTNGLSYPLEETVLPLNDLKAVASLLPILEVDMPYDMRWLNFKTLGVTTEKTLDLYVRQLKAMTRPDVFGTRPLKKSDVREIYKELAARWTAGAQLLK